MVYRRACASRGKVPNTSDEISCHSWGTRRLTGVSEEWLLPLQVMWKFLGQKSFPLSEQQYMDQLEAVAELLTEWGCADQVRQLRLVTSLHHVDSADLSERLRLQWPPGPRRAVSCPPVFLRTPIMPWKEGGPPEPNSSGWGQH